MICSLLYKEDFYDCREVDNVWDEFVEEYKVILDPSILDDNRADKNRPPKKLLPNILNESAKELLDNFQLLSGSKYIKDWKTCFLNEKQVCTACLLNKQISILKRMK